VPIILNSRLPSPLSNKHGGNSSSIPQPGSIGTPSTNGSVFLGPKKGTGEKASKPGFGIGNPAPAHLYPSGGGKFLTRSHYTLSVEHSVVFPVFLRSSFPEQLLATHSAQHIMHYVIDYTMVGSIDEAAEREESFWAFISFIPYTALLLQPDPKFPTQALMMMKSKPYSMHFSLPSTLKYFFFVFTEKQI